MCLLGNLAGELLSRTLPRESSQLMCVRSSLSWSINGLCAAPLVCPLFRTVIMQAPTVVNCRRPMTEWISVALDSLSVSFDFQRDCRNIQIHAFSIVHVIAKKSRHGHFCANVIVLWSAERWESTSPFLVYWQLTILGTFLDKKADKTFLQQRLQ